MEQDLNQLVSLSLSKKELFTAVALHAVLTANPNMTYHYKDAAEQAVKYAEALMKELE